MFCVTVALLAAVLSEAQVPLCGIAWIVALLSGFVKM